MRLIFSITLLSLLLFSCNGTEECENAPDVSSIDINLKIERLEKGLFAAHTKQEVKTFLNQNPVVANQIFMASQYPDDSTLVNQVHQLINDPYIDTLYQDTEAIFSDFSAITSEFEQAFRYIKYYFPNFAPPVINTIVTGLSADFYVSDSLLVIGIDFFQGKDAQYQPKVYDYMLNRFQPEYIVPSSILLYSNRWNNTDESDNSLLAEMIFYGKSFYFTKKMLPCTPDSLIIGYSQPQMELVSESEKTIWSYFIDKQLLYTNNEMEKTRYLSERPSTIEISGEVPGRIGQWIGWQIVKSFAENNPEVSVNELMQMKNAQEIFRRAKYKP